MPFAEGGKQEPKPLSFFHRKGEEERPQPAPGLAPGKVVGDFRLVALIGQGGMGQVWEAEQVSLHRTVAVKFERPERVTERQLELFAREARAGGRLHHPGIVTVHGYGQSDGLAWIAMEFVSGAWTLHDFLDEVARADEVPEGYDRHVARFVAEVADAMHTAHEAGVIHRDLKPQNVLIAPDEHLKVTDFGLARITDETAMSQTGDFAGTYFYMSPEQVTARRMGLDHRTDVFSLGIVLYEMLALQRPFQGDTSHQVAAQIVTKDPPDPRTLRSKVPRDLAVIAGHALEKDRDKRYPTMKELAADLRRYLADEPIHATPPTRVDRTVKWIKRNPTKSTAAAIAAVAFVAITLLLVENVRARNDLSASNQALAAKTTEALASATEARENARVAKANEARATEEKVRADREAEAATRRADEVLRLSALRMQVALESSEPLRDPTPEEVGLDLASLPATANDVNGLAWDLIDPDRKDWGGEAKGLVLARRAVELAAELSPDERAGIRDSLAWALFANGRFEEATAEEEQALEEAAADKKAELEAYLEKLRKKIEEEIEPAKEEKRERRVAEIEERIAALEAEVSQRPEWQFADAEDKWWHNQLEKLVNGLETFADKETGLASSGISAEHGWGVEKRAEFARTIAERSLIGPEGGAKWAEASESIADTTECPAYEGLRIDPQLGLLPIGRDPESGLWEFAHLQTGEPAKRGPDGKLILDEETGLVFVLLPGGTFTMGAQRGDPNGPNYDPEANPDEGPPRSVTLSAFFLSKYEMTQGQWLRFTGANPSRDNPETYSRSWNASGRAGNLLLPVEQVSWSTCTTTLERMGLMLPSEAQWEFGARGGTTSVWWTGGEKQSLAGAANLADRYAREHGASGWTSIEEWLDDGNTSHAHVGNYRANPFGLHDAHGNVWEWCQDKYGAGSASRVNRGGGFITPASNARAANRNLATPSHAADGLGLRPARALLAP